MAGLFAKRTPTNQQLLKRSCESLLGICTGMLADGYLVNEEIRFLDTWLSENEEIAGTWPGEVICARVREVLADGVISDDERQYLTETLSELLDGTLEQVAATAGMDTKLPLDPVTFIEVTDNSFCFTGTFLYGTREACEQAILDRGGEVTRSVRANLDYLVIGSLITDLTANTNYGRKIEQAVDLRSQGSRIKIVSEEQWVQFL